MDSYKFFYYTLGYLAKISLIGYADDIGSEDSNNKLPQRRANSIKMLLCKDGFLSKNIEVQSKGEVQLSKNVKVDEDRQSNRRVEIKIVY